MDLGADDVVLSLPGLVLQALLKGLGGRLGGGLCGLCGLVGLGGVEGGCGLGGDVVLVAGFAEKGWRRKRKYTSNTLFYNIYESKI